MGTSGAARFGRAVARPVSICGRLPSRAADGHVPAGANAAPHLQPLVEEDAEVGREADPPPEQQALSELGRIPARAGQKKKRPVHY